MASDPLLAAKGQCVSSQRKTYVAVSGGGKLQISKESLEFGILEQAVHGLAQFPWRGFASRLPTAGRRRGADTCGRWSTDETKLHVTLNLGLGKMTTTHGAGHPIGSGSLHAAALS